MTKNQKPGLYEEIINHRLQNEIQQLSSSSASVRPLDEADAPKILAGYVSQRLEQKLRILSERKDSSVDDQIAFANEILKQLENADEEEPQNSETITEPGRELLAINDKAQPLHKFLGVMSTTRASFAFYNNEEDIEAFLSCLGRIRSEMGYED